MKAVEYFLWLGAQAFEVPILFPPAGLLMVLGGMGAFPMLVMVQRIHRRRAAIAIILPLIPPVMILWCGVAFAHDTTLNTTAPAWPEWMISGLLIAHLVLSAVLLALLRGVRWLALATCAATFGYAIGAAFMSTMSVSGRWL